MISGRDILKIKLYVLKYLKISHKTYIVHTRPNVTRHITYWAKRFVNPHCKDPINSHLLIYIHETHTVYEVFIV